ncbi:cupin domain-containing protein [Herbiconiux sp. SYSU D00978]|uniref:cupin domain-containing protein n=1 Tax=Herbiconiux sp. SYSU D00978 TaxID=2812562 RepID=UPI001A9764B8|nr:cupin domain-containing protein [Herbiconiux sp. SYSU D00978]
MTQPLQREIYNPVQRDRVTFLKTASETDGELTLVEMVVAPGGGNVLHYHRSFTEQFFAKEGELSAQVGERRLILHPGENALVPIGIVHRWFNASTSEPARVHVELRPGHEGFEQSLRIAYGLATDGLVDRRSMPTNPLHLAVLLELSDTRAVGALRVMNVTLGGLARVAKARGVDEALKRRYCR